MFSDCVDQTIAEKEEELKSIMKIAQAIQTTVITELNDPHPHVAQITSRKYDDISKLPITYERCVELANKHNAVDEIFANLWLELGESIRNLIIGNYGSIPRSLRWMLESTLFYADFQEDSGNAVEQFNEYLQEESPLRERRYRYLLHHIDDSNFELLDERLLLKERYEINFSRIKEQVKIFGDARYPKEVKGIPGELSELYRKFSALIHISQQSLEEKERDEEGYALFLDSSYVRRDFQEKLNDIWKVIDLITSVLLLVCSRFYGYSSAIEFLDNITSYDPANSFAKDLVKLAKSKKIKNKLPRFLSLLDLNQPAPK
jgi:hypothetical protein